MPQIPNKRPDALSWMMMALLSLIWGTSFILIKKGLEGFTPYQLGALRISLSMIALSPFIRKWWRRIEPGNRKYVLLVGVFGSGLPPFLFALAETRIPSGMAGILNTSTPLFTFLLGLVIIGTRFSWLRAAGVVLGMLGAVLLLSYGLHNPEKGTLWYALLVVAATVCYATSVTLVKRYLQTTPSLAITAVSFAMIGLPALAYLLGSDFLFRLQHHPAAWASLGYIAILAIVGTALANIIFFYMTQRTSALFASTVTYFIPVIAVLWGLLDGEQLGWVHVGGMVLILAGVYLASRTRQGS